MVLFADILNFKMLPPFRALAVTVPAFRPLAFGVPAFTGPAFRAPGQILARLKPSELTVDLTCLVDEDAVGIFREAVDEAA